MKILIDMPVDEGTLTQLRASVPCEIDCLVPPAEKARDVDPTKLKESGRRGRDEEDEDPWTAERFVTSFLTSTATSKDAIFAKAIQGGLGERRAKLLLALCLDDGLIHEHKIVGKRIPYYSLLPQ